MLPTVEAEDGHSGSLLRQFTHPEALLAYGLTILISALTYLPLVPKLGYYHDDWHLIAGTANNTDIFWMFLIDRPFMGWLYARTDILLGESPLAWHLFAFFARLIGILAFLWLVRMLWPKRTALTTAMAMIFVVYPGFLQQPMGNTFQNHFLGYSAALVSIAFTVRALYSRSRTEKIVLTVLAMGGTLFYQGIYEYMIGLEGLRFALIWLVLWREERKSVSRHTILANTGRALLVYLPYLLMTATFLVWRVFIFKGKREATDVGALLSQYKDQPLSMLLRFVVELVKDVIETLLVAWGLPVYRAASAASYSALFISLALGAIVAGLLVWYLRRPAAQVATVGEGRQRWIAEASWLGLIGLLVGLAPVILANRDVQYQHYFDRYTLQATAGMAMLTGAGLFALLRPRPRQWALVALALIGVVTQYNNADHFRAFWDAQKSLWWQLTWRAPQLARETLLMPLMPPAYRFGEDFEIWAPANRIYSEPGDFRIKAEVLNIDTIGLVLNGPNDSGRFIRNMFFTRDFSKALVLWLNEPDGCVHVLDTAQIELGTGMDTLVSMAANNSHSDLIEVDEQEHVPPAHIFGAEPEHGWCYTYQKASLARQRGEWQEVLRLQDEAEQRNLVPSDPFEWLPFYEAALNVGDEPRAAKLLERINYDINQNRTLCENLHRSSGAYSDPAVYDEMVSSICAAAK